ncbi:PSD1 and planctomycete cytochrome C domain-containing protein [Aureliella helgolandensis]|uniref:Planctomycete cytochrome C n=1 Tax=Aureliella helgolandensis TaxID=2527968 RepID=A0A518GF93_9BACT|nr:PSD1 and planctomycete cytochrome C domain-containing protein [Aureliella helgolandensis]QDV27264.1 Planctomycete cytochrome C [Aureliella helgolandensis]
MHRINLQGFTRQATIGLLAACSSLTAAAQSVDFRSEVRPILSDKCYACHGPDATQRPTDLRLDTHSGALADLGGYVAVAPGDPDKSELVRRIVSSDADEVMPPQDHLKQLTEEEREVLIRWVAQGAEWSEHWSYTPPKRHAPPATTQREWAHNWIDFFILSKLEKRGLTPSQDADRRTLIRRLSFDLVGLPPDPVDVTKFLADDSEEAYEKVVDRLLQSPHFGERMAMAWLDLVRYADTVGYHGDQDMSVSPFRDYVINAFNANLPFDQFTREQLAGDLLDAPTQEQKIASGYNRLGMMSAEGGVQPEEYLVKYAADRVRTASTVWLGSTLGCAECHDHKFDPFTAKDFYRFAAFFADIKERGLYDTVVDGERWGPSVQVPDPTLPSLLAPVDQQIQQVQRKIDAPSPELIAELQQAQAVWEAELRLGLQAWQTLQPTSASAQAGTSLTIREDATLLASGKNPKQNSYQVSFELPEAPLTGLCLEVLPDASLPNSGPGRAGNGNFVLTEFKAFLEDAEGTRHPIPFTRARASIEQEAGGDNPYGKWAAAAAIDADAQGASWGWAILPEAGQTNYLTLGFEKAVAISGGKLVVVLEQNHTNPTHTLGCFRLHGTALTAATEARFPEALPAAIPPVLAIEASQRTASQRQILSDYFRATAPQLEPLRQQLDALMQERQTIVAAHTRTTLVTMATAPREMRVLKRGDWMDKTGEVVQPGVPHFLPPLESSQSAENETPRRATRLDLANWIVARDNPLTARVFVNRLWTMLFGVGLSKVLDDVGSQGEAPVHPELLDTLAVEFMESGWDIKSMIKLMVMSHTYRQSSYGRSDLREADPFNRLVARQARFRLDAEIVRDNALAVSGLLVREIGGRSAKPYQPAGLYQHLNFPTREYLADTDQNQYRRGVYTHWQRQFLHPALQAMDAPAREECTAQRPRSNTPLAALVLLNDPSYVEAARELAEHAMELGGETSTTRLEWLAQRTLSRSFTPAEQQVLLELLDAHLHQYSVDATAARELLEIGLSPPNPKLPVADWAAWTSVARALLNMHETITRN